MDKLSGPATWETELAQIVELMRDISRQSDPQAAAVMYGARLREQRLLPAEGFISISRRDLSAPEYRVTRASIWKEPLNPWSQRDQLPHFSDGLLGELIYSNEPAVITNLPARLSDKDPMLQYLRGYEMLVTLPQYDEGEALNMTAVLVSSAATFPMERIPFMVWQSNLWGRSVNNLVLRQNLEKTHAALGASHAALDEELRTVGAVQRSLLPESLPEIPGLALSASYEPSQRAGGDYYDVFDCGDGRWGILMADVAGHGAAAAVVMAVTHAIAHLHPGKGAPPSELLGFVNHTLCKRYIKGSGKFVTAFYAIFDPRDRTLTFSSAGHPAPRLIRHKAIEPWKGPVSLPLGIVDDERYCNGNIQLQPGDALVMYTDGITEARGPANELFGEERLDAALRGASAEDAPLHPDALLDVVTRQVARFSDGRAASDDRTMLAMVLAR